MYGPVNVLYWVDTIGTKGRTGEEGVQANDDGSILGNPPPRDNETALIL